MSGGNHAICSKVLLIEEDDGEKVRSLLCRCLSVWPAGFDLCRSSDKKIEKRDCHVFPLSGATRVAGRCVLGLLSPGVRLRIVI